MSGLGALPVVVACAGAAALAVRAHYAYWSWRLRVPSGEDELLEAPTADGWRLALGRRRPRGTRRRAPVLLVHGVAANRGAVDFGLERWSLAAHLAAAGFDCFALDLRAHGASRRGRGAPRGGSFDDFLRLDAPAALEAVRAATGQAQVLWVGHSMGGLLGMAACACYPERVAGLVALGSPAWFGEEGPLRLLARLGLLTGGRGNRFLARCLAPFSGYYHPPVSEIAINARNVARPVLRRVLANVVEDAPLGLVRQFGRWIATDTWAAEDGALDYRAALAGCRQPALFVAADGDRIAPPAVVERAARAWGGPARLLRVGVAGAACCDYGHSDLLYGRAAPEEVFGPVGAWLAALPAAAPAGRDGQ